MQKFSDSSRMKSQKLMKTSLKRNVKKISIGAVLLAVGFSSYAVIASDDSMVSSKGKGVSIAAAGNTLYADNTADYGEATSSVALADGTLSDVNKTGSVALFSHKRWSSGEHNRGSCNRGCTAGSRHNKVRAYHTDEG